MIRSGAGLRSKMALILLAVITSACSPSIVEWDMPSREEERASPDTKNSSPEVLADCFLAFILSAWQDLDGDGEWDPSEPPLQGIEFRINGRFASLLSDDPCISDLEGYCMIATWAPGNCEGGDFSITAAAPEPYTPSTPAAITLSLTSTDFSQKAQFGFNLNDE